MATPALTFKLPESLNAISPAEHRGIRRDHVRMMVINRENNRTSHDHFHHLGHYLKSGDLLVLNNSRTIPAVLHAEVQRNGKRIAEEIEIRLAHRKSDAEWQVVHKGKDVKIGDCIIFSDRLSAVVIRTEESFTILRFSLSGISLYNEIYTLGEPIRYSYIKEKWGLDDYQTVYGSVPGSVEMPSAGRPFSWEMLLALRKQGIRLAFLTLHTGLSDLLDGREGAHINTEEYILPAETVEAVKKTKTEGGRVIAVGTTVVRTLETAANAGKLAPSSGWTDLYIHEKYPLRITDGLITGFHEPEASHLDLLSAFLDKDRLYDNYQRAIVEKYLWHEFGDINVII
ncbi:MAG TPA: S-adenosylmethionine:tRNA ribosyltransferase-isomerase [Bacillales bacterium]